MFFITLGSFCLVRQWLAITCASWRRWENPLIGWTSTADPMESVARSTLAFFSQEEAEAFCTKHGWAYEVLSPKPQVEARPKRFIGYGDNFRCGKPGPRGHQLSIPENPDVITITHARLRKDHACMRGFPLTFFCVFMRQCEEAWLPPGRPQVRGEERKGKVIADLV